MGLGDVLSGIFGGGGDGGDSAFPTIFDEEEAEQQFEDVQSGVDDFQGNVEKYSGRYFDADFNKDEVDALAGRAQEIGLGGEDPAFAAFREREVKRATGQVSEMTGRAGFGASSASANQLERVGGDLSSRFGLASLQRGDAARAEAAGLYGQSAQMEQMGLDATTAGLENELAGVGLDVGVLGTILPFTGEAEEEEVLDSDGRPQGGNPRNRPDTGGGA